MAMFSLTNAEARNEAFGVSFRIPLKHERERIEPGDLVLLAVNVNATGYYEWLWVEATAARRGKLRRDPADPQKMPLKAGDEVEFRPKHIIEIIRASLEPVQMTSASPTAAPAAPSKGS